MYNETFIFYYWYIVHVAILATAIRILCIFKIVDNEEYSSSSFHSDAIEWHPPRGQIPIVLERVRVSYQPD